MSVNNAIICVGVISGSYGIHGELRIKSFCAVPEDIESYNPLTNEHEKQSFTLALVRPIKNGFVARIANIATKEQADELRGTQLFARRADLPNLPDDEYYHNDLTGIEVFDTGGIPLGLVKSVQNHGAGDLLEINVFGKKETVLLPFTLETVPTVDLVLARIIVDPPAGVF